MFPQDNYTPHGYLDNPAHAWKAGPGGVLRSRPAIGVGWHYPSFPHGYNYIWHYRTHLQLIFQTEQGSWLFDSADFAKAGLNLYSDYHSKNWLSYVFELPNGLRVRALFFLAQAAKDGDAGDALGCLVQFRNRSGTAQNCQFVAALDYERQPGQGLDWASGLYSRPNGHGVSIGAFQEGTAFHLLSQPSAAYPPLMADSLDDLHSKLANHKPLDSASLTDENVIRKIGAFQYNVECAAGGEQTFLLTVARAVSEYQAVKRATRLLADDGAGFYEALAGGRERDNTFWQTAPKLTGDWPDYVRRGLVYDFETLRMVVRQPAGIYQHPWDSMQIQVPRVVLAEAALDALILSYADPATAKALLLGTFADSPEPNVPCSREDASYNMIASDGSACGTAPEWCFPFHCIELVYRRTADRVWLGQLYPYLEAFVEWWQRNRSDPQGLPYYKCSWEAGQDNSARFGIKDDPSGGGALTEHLWPVDLQAALAQCCWLLAAWATDLGLATTKIEQWNQQAQNYAAGLQRLWQPGQNWFHDFDRRTGRPTEVLDTMQLAPLLCRAANPEQIAALHSKLENPPLHGQVFPALMWPSTAFCLIEACHEAGRSDLAARHSWAALERVYRWTDARPETVAPDKGGLPGVGREYWPQVSQSPDNSPLGQPVAGGGTEVYGWGCLSAYLLLRYVIGLQEERPVDGKAVGFTLQPNLPPALLQSGKVYRVQSLPCLGLLLDITYRVEVADQLTVTVATGPEQIQQFTLKNGQLLHITF